MVMINMFVMLNHTSMYDRHFQLQIVLPFVPEIGSSLFLGKEHLHEFAEIIMKNWRYIQSNYDEYARIDNLHTLEDFVDFVNDFSTVENVLYNTNEKKNPTIHLKIT
jgi:hypothetical protein